MADVRCRGARLARIMQAEAVQREKKVAKMQCGPTGVRLIVLTGVQSTPSGGPAPERLTEAIAMRSANILSER